MTTTAAPPPPRPPPRPPPPCPQPVAPLTGLPGDYEGRIDRPALVVKIDNGEPKARPQVGLNEADVVYEERVEGSVTRLLAIFHSTDSAPVGPVRSARTSDIAIFTPLHQPFFAWSGANATFARRIRAAELTDVGYDARTSEYFREPGRPAPAQPDAQVHGHDQGAAERGRGPPPPLFSYRGGQKTAHLVRRHRARRSTSGRAAAARRSSTAGTAPAGPGPRRARRTSTPPASRWRRRTSSSSSSTTPPPTWPTSSATPSPRPSWWARARCGCSPRAGSSRAGGRSPIWPTPTAYTDADGNPILLAPGRTWIALPPPGGARTI